jgi:spore maturation protein CgeB
MKVLLSETWSSHIYAEAFYRRFQALGVDVHGFKEGAFYGSRDVPWPARLPMALLRRAEARYRVGPALGALNDALVRKVRSVRPDAVFLFRGDSVVPETVRRIKALGVHVLGWNNDDPFSTRARWYVWRHFVRSIPLYDRLWAYRQANVRSFVERGCRRAGLLRSFYLEEWNHPVEDTSASPFRAQVSFIGHWEDDGRDRFVEALLDEPSLDFKLWGTLWERSVHRRRLRRRYGAIRPLYLQDYNLAINSAGISLVFLSKLNNDTYTRRCFEIPVTGTMMLSEHTDDLASLFREGEEAEFFRSPPEMMDKIRFYLAHDEARRKIGQAGRRRVLRDGHEAMDRARTVLDTLRADLGRATGEPRATPR